MTALDSDYAFASFWRRTADTANSDHAEERSAVAAAEPAVAQMHGGIAAFSIFAGLAIMSAVIFTTGYLALLSDTPAIWIHRLMALTLAQSILISAVAMKLLPLIEGPASVRIIADEKVERQALPDNSAANDEPAEAAPPSLPPRPIVGGKLAGREYLQHADGTIEIDTLVGRRRFASIAAAREFVGA
jgi:hypothetical protein